MNTVESIRYYWEFPGLKRYRKYNDVADVVFRVGFQLTPYAMIDGVEYKGKQQQGRVYLDITGVSGGATTPFEELTREMVSEWVIAKLQAVSVDDPTSEFVQLTDRWSSMQDRIAIEFKSLEIGAKVRAVENSQMTDQNVHEGQDYGEQ